MKCPVCKDVTLLMSEKQGVEIDYCPECRGIWLDRGELEKLIEKEQSYNQRREESRRYEEDYHKHDYDKEYRDHYKDDAYYKKNKYGKKKKKESFMSEIFDMFGD